MGTVKKKWSGWAVALLFTLIFIPHLKAATLSVGSASGSPGDKDVFIPVELSSTPGEKVCGFNFDLNFDISKLFLKEVSLGPIAKAAGKSLLYRQLESSIVRVLVISINRNVMENGTVLNFSFDILDSAAAGRAALMITDPFITDPNAHLLPVTTENGGIIVEEEPPDSTTTTSTTTPITVITTTSTSIQPPLPDTTTSTSTTTLSSSTTTINTTTSIDPIPSSTTTSASQLWPLLYDKMWGNKKEVNLVLLRAFRDEILLHTEIGRNYTVTLYNNSLEIVILLLQEPSLAAQTKEVINEFLISVESLFYNDRMEIRRDTIVKFQSLLDHAETKASPELKAAIKKLKKDIREEKVFTQLGINIQNNQLKRRMIP